MVTDLGVSNIPMPIFMVIHLAATAIALSLAFRSYSRGLSPLFTTAFVLYAVSEVVYMGYHVEITTFLLSHTISEVLVLVAFLCASIGVVQSRRQPSKTAPVRA